MSGAIEINSALLLYRPWFTEIILLSALYREYTFIACDHPLPLYHVQWRRI